MVIAGLFTTVENESSLNMMAEERNYDIFMQQKRINSPLKEWNLGHLQQYAGPTDDHVKLDKSGTEK